jgi:uncharacterized protein (DUF2344 family)
VITPSLCNLHQTIIIIIVIVDRESKISQKRISKEDKRKIAQEVKKISNTFSRQLVQSWVLSQLI